MLNIPFTTSSWPNSPGCAVSSSCIHTISLWYTHLVKINKQKALPNKILYFSLKHIEDLNVHQTGFVLFFNLYAFNLFQLTLTALGDGLDKSSRLGRARAVIVAGFTDASSENSYGSGDGERGSGVARWECDGAGEIGSSPLVLALGRKESFTDS